MDYWRGNLFSLQEPRSCDTTWGACAIQVSVEEKGLGRGRRWLVGKENPPPAPRRTFFSQSFGSFWCVAQFAIFYLTAKDFLERLSNK